MATPPPAVGLTKDEQHETMSTRPAARNAAVITVLASICVALADAFAAASIGGKSLGAAPSPSASAGRPRRATASLSSTLRAGAVDVETIPSWDELSQTLLDAAPSAEPEKSLVTLYRDTNGWCPFCERVWLILRAKGIPYDELTTSSSSRCRISRSSTRRWCPRCSSLPCSFTEPK